MDTFEDYPNFNPRPGYPEKITVSTRWKKREWGGWSLVEARTGRVLGWIVRIPEDPNAWNAYVYSGAFRGDGIDDLGDTMDVVPAWLYNGVEGNHFKHRRIATAARRWDAAHAIVWHLVQHHAPAVGYGRRLGVEMSKWNPKHPDYKGSIQEEIDNMRYEAAGAK